MGTTAVAGQPSASSSAALNAESAMPSTAFGARAATCSRASATLVAGVLLPPVVERGRGSCCGSRAPAARAAPSRNSATGEEVPSWYRSTSPGRARYGILLEVRRLVPGVRRGPPRRRCRSPTRPHAGRRAGRGCGPPWRPGAGGRARTGGRRSPLPRGDHEVLRRPEQQVVDGVDGGVHGGRVRVPSRRGRGDGRRRRSRCPDRETRGRRAGGPTSRGGAGGRGRGPAPPAGRRPPRPRARWSGAPASRRRPAGTPSRSSRPLALVRAQPLDRAGQHDPAQGLVGDHLEVVERPTRPARRPPGRGPARGPGPTDRPRRRRRRPPAAPRPARRRRSRPPPPARSPRPGPRRRPAPTRSCPGRSPGTAPAGRSGDPVGLDGRLEVLDVVDHDVEHPRHRPGELDDLGTMKFDVPAEPLRMSRLT